MSELAVTYITPLVVGGISDAKVLERLMSRGLNHVEARNIQQAVFAKHSRKLQVSGAASGPLWWLGCVVVAAGGVVGLGNISGFFPTMPGMGKMLMIMGIVMAGSGFFTGRR